MTDFTGRVSAALASPGACWFEGLASHLAAWRWHALAREAALDRRTYGTARFLARDPASPRDVAASVTLPPVFAASGPVLVEMLHGEPLQRYADIGLDFHGDGALSPAKVVARLHGAMDRIACIPPVAAVVGALLAVLHIIRPEGPEYDVSYSDPVLPFSIFIGVDGHVVPNGDLRLAEGILHECMHLQLTLVEEAVPMVLGAERLIFSPWQRRMRPAQGILHGLYVFRVIRDFHLSLLSLGELSAVEETYLRGRLDVIGKELLSVADLACSDELTADGRRLAARLLDVGHPRP